MAYTWTLTVFRRKQPLWLDHKLAAAKKQGIMPTQEQIMKTKGNSKKGYILEMDLGYPEELHEEHKSYQVATEKKKLLKRRCLGTKSV